MTKTTFGKFLKPHLGIMLIGVAGCSNNKPYEEPTGVLLIFTIVSFAIAVISIATVIFDDEKKTSADHRGLITLIGFAFLAVAILLLFSSRL